MSNTTQPGLHPARVTPDYYQLIHILTRDLPKPLDDSPEALYARNQAAVERVAALLPVNANESSLAALSVAARAQAEDLMRLLRVHDGEIQIIMKLNAQYVAMSRTSLSAQNQLLRVQALRHKREANDTAREADGWTKLVAEGSMRQALDVGPLSAVPAAEPAAPEPAAEKPPPPAVAPAALAAPKPVHTEAPPPPPATRPVVYRRDHIPDAPVQVEGQPRNLEAEAEQYMVLYLHRAWEIRRHGGVPPNSSYGPPDDDLVHAIVTGTSPLLCALDGPEADAIGFLPDVEDAAELASLGL